MLPGRETILPNAPYARENHIIGSNYADTLSAVMRLAHVAIGGLLFRRQRLRPGRSTSDAGRTKEEA